VTVSDIPRLSLFERRALSSGELMMARFMFADERPFARTQVVQGPRLGFGAMAPTSGAIIFSNWSAARDFACAHIEERALFVHELTHIWQALRGTVMPFAKLGALGAAAYSYRYKPGKPFSAYNIEQQAEIARHLFLARSGVKARNAPDLSALEAVWPVPAPTPAVS
jgi:hypothetical protein